MRTIVLWVLFAVGIIAAADADPSTVRVTDVWSRPASGTGVIYATLHNDAPVADRLIGASSPIAAHIGLHQTAQMTMPGMSTSMGNMPMGGSMVSMRSLASIPIPARGAMRLAPGGYHLMLDLRRDLKAGETVPIKLHFARAGWISASAHVRPLK